MSKQLTKEIRAEIVARVIRKTFSQREEELKKAVTAFADQAYEKLIPEQFLAVAGSLPSTYFMQSSAITLDDKADALFNPTSIIQRGPTVTRHERQLSMSTKRPFPYDLVDWPNHRAKLSIRGETSAVGLRNEHQGLVKTAKLIVAEKDSMKERLTALLYSIRTIKALLDVAPEMKPFIPADAMEVRAPMPAPVVGTLIADLMKAGLKLQTVEV